MNEGLKKSIYLSFTLHLLIMVYFIFQSNRSIKKTFIVFGAHSKKNYETLYNSPTSIDSSIKNTPTIKPNKSNYKNKKTKPSTNQKKSTVKDASTKKTILNKHKSLSNKKSSQINKTKIKHNQRSSKKIESIIQKTTPAQSLKKNIEKQDKKIVENKKRNIQKNSIAQTEQEIKKQIIPEITPIPLIKPLQHKNENSKQSLENSIELNETITKEPIFTSIKQTIDKEISIYQKHIQKEVERLWKPPLGVPKGTTCRINFSVGTEGKIENFEIIKKSNILIYDLSVLHIAHRFNFDKCLWGEKIIIDFCQ